MKETNDAVTWTKEEFQNFLTALRDMAQPKMNPLEQKKFEEEAQKDARRNQMQVELAKVEMAKQKQRKEGCSHCRWPATAGKKGGHAAPRGQGEWVTQAQLHEQNGTIDLMCQRCTWIWRWKATPEEISYMKDNDGGMAGFPPPSEDRIVWQG